MDFGRRGLRRLRRETLCGIHRMQIPVNGNDRRIKALKDKHAGARVFILGNGPSLKVADLDRLRGEITLASNKVYLAFDQTPWRPTYYFITDRLVAKNNAEVIRNLKLTKLFGSDIKKFFPTETDIIWMREEYRNDIWIAQAQGASVAGRGFFSTDLMVEFVSGWTVIFAQLQAAFYFGAKEVVLLGVDFSFDVPKKRVTTNEAGYEVALESQGERNHFHPDYRKPGEVWALPDLEMQHRAFSLARDVYAEHGRTIINASRQTKLDVFPRANLDDLLPGRV